MSIDQKPQGSNQTKNDPIGQDQKQTPVDYTAFERTVMGVLYVVFTPLAALAKAVFDIKHKLIHPIVKHVSNQSHTDRSVVNSKNLFKITSDPAQSKIGKPVMVLLIIVVSAIALLLIASLLTRK